MFRTFFVEGIDFSYSRTVRFNQAKPVKNFGKFVVSWLGYTAFYVIGRKPGQKSANGNKLYLLIVYIYDDASAEAVVAMNYCVEQRFSQSRIGIILIFNSFKPFEG